MSWTSDLFQLLGHHRRPHSGCRVAAALHIPCTQAGRAESEIEGDLLVLIGVRHEAACSWHEEGMDPRVADGDRALCGAVDDVDDAVHAAQAPGLGPEAHAFVPRPQ